MINSPEQWSDLFVASASAAAALAGLVTVAISVNVEQIIKYRQLPSRAGATIAELVLILIVATLGLVHAQSLTAFGWEILLAIVLVWMIELRSAWMTLTSRPKRKFSERLYRMVMSQIGLVPYLVASILLINGSLNGFYWLAASFVFGFILSMFNAWVLLIEILR